MRIQPGKTDDESTRLNFLLTPEDMELVRNLSAQQEKRTNSEILILNDIVDSLRLNSLSAPLINSESLSLVRQHHVIFFEKLASANRFDRHKNRIPNFRQLVLILALLEDPIEKLNLKSTGSNPGQKSIFLRSALQKLAKYSFWSMKSLSIDIKNSGEWFTGQQLMHNVLNLKYLTELCLPSYIFKKEDFEDVCKNLSFLSSLNCNIDAYMTCASLLEGLHRLTNLRKFIFNVLECHLDNSYSIVQDVCEYTSRLCVIEFPLMNVIGRSLSDSYRHQEEQITVCHVLSDEDAGTLSGTSSLQHLVVKKRMHPKQVKWHSKCADSLHVLYLDTDADWEPLLQLKNVQFLYITKCNFSPTMLTRLLKTFSSRLKLFSCCTREDYALDDVFKCCPQLETLDTNTMHPLPRVPEGLIKLHWTFLNREHDYNALVQVLTAPHLENLTIKLIDMDWRRMTNITNTLRARDDVAPKLKSLSIRSSATFVLQIDKSKQVLFNLLAVICTKAPHLNKVEMPTDDLERAFYFINERRVLFD